eukprot:m.88523 g.88523  ORF g.88523 m.88523 type:complete len:424 (+) comp9763_c0_seq2:28-1299(+)
MDTDMGDVVGDAPQDEMMSPAMLDEDEVLEVLDDGNEVDELGNAVEGGAADIEEEEGEEEEGEDDAEVTEVLEDNSNAQFTGHTGAVFSVDVHPNGELAVSGGEDDTAYLWRVADGSLVRELAKHEDSVVCVAFNRDGKFVATGSMDGVIHVWNVEDGAKVCDLDCGDDLNWFEWHPVAPFIIAATDGGALYMWDVPGANQSFFSAQTMSASCGGWAPDGRNFISGSEDGSVVLWSPKTGSVIARVNDNDGVSAPQWGPLTAARWSPAGGQIAVGTAAGVVNLIQAKAGKVVSSFNLGETIVESVALSHTSPPLLAAATMLGETVVYDIASQRQLHTFQHTHGVNKVVWCTDRPSVICSTLGGTTHVWNCTTGECEQTMSGASTTHVLDFVVSPSGSQVVTCGEDSVCRVYTVGDTGMATESA